MTVPVTRLAGLAVAATLLAVPALAQKRITEAEAMAAMKAADERCREAASPDDRAKIWKSLVKELRGRKIEVTDAPVSGFVSWLKWVPQAPDEGQCAPAPGQDSKFSRQAVVDSRYEMFDLAPDQLNSEAHDRARRGSLGVTVVRTSDGQAFEWVLVIPPWAAREAGGPGASLKRGQRVAFECYPVLVSTTGMLCKVAGIDTRAR